MTSDRSNTPLITSEYYATAQPSNSSYNSYEMASSASTQLKSDDDDEDICECCQSNSECIECCNGFLQLLCCCCMFVECLSLMK
ncbi:unnamed protein product [Adineta steineri]|uniref:Uncharacterized protein n=1 Tax=Adineta steineri TaxID=433720 RepID=A0A814A7Q8_9BILA|nr:unnamed protein product [Adineta steineri]CAF4408557.1 unnamed protein product [Adineta steineri]